MSIEVRHLTKRFGDFQALQDVSVHVRDGELMALLGPSGSGKTTLLRVIAGLEPPDAGTVLHDDRDMTQAAARDRNVGFVFQHFALFSHLDVFENIAFALRVRKRPDPEVKQRVHELLDLIQLGGLERRMPAQLSGGQRQRVALARALAARPRVMLLDEPFSALDAQVRHELRRWLRKLHEEIGTTCVFVTHDQEEAFELADRVAVFHRGRIEQVGTPQEVWTQPASAFVLEFLGHVHGLAGTVRGDRLELAAGTVALASPWPDGAAVTGWLRTHDLDLREVEDADLGIQATVEHITWNGARLRIGLTTRAGEVLQAEVEREDWLATGRGPGAQVRVVPRRVHVFAREATQSS